MLSMDTDPALEPRSVDPSPFELACCANPSLASAPTISLMGCAPPGRQTKAVIQTEYQARRPPN